MKRLAQVLRSKRELILEQWRHAVVNDKAVPRAAELSAPALRDHVPKILDAIIEALDTELGGAHEAGQGRMLAELKMPREHARERFGEGFTLAALLRELSHLRAAIVDSYWSEHDFDSRGVRFLHAALDECAAIAAVQLEEAARRDLEEAVELRERFVAILSHDLRSPLNTVKMVNGIMRTSTTVQKELLVRSDRAVERMTRMIEELLDFTKVQAGTLVLDRVPCDMCAICDELIAELHVAQPDRRIILDATGDTTGKWDRLRVTQIIANLLSNALQYSPLNTTVRVDIRPSKTEVVVAVHNHGEPIPKESQARIFDAFQRAATPLENAEGVGLGLYIASSLARAHGGTLEVESEATKGTTFTLRLPR